MPRSIGPAYPPTVATTRPRRSTRPAGKPPEQDPREEPVAEAPSDALPATPPAPAPDAILQRAVEEAARLLQTDGAMAYLLDEATGVLRFATDAGITDDRRRDWVQTLKLDVGTGMFGRAAAEGVVVTTGDYLADDSFVHVPDADRLVRDIDIHSLVVAPLGSGGRMFGAMGTFSSRRNAFTDADVALVRSLADHAAAAMANADLIVQLGRSRAELERRAEAERALREIGGRIIALRHPEEVLQRSVDEAARLLSADGARIDILDANGALYWAYDATTGRLPGLGPIAGTGEAKAGEGISGRAVRELRPVFTGDYLVDDRFEHASAPDEHVRRYAIRSVVAVPLIGDRGPLGTLTVYSGDADSFTEDDARLIEALAGQAAIAMTNARLIEELDAAREASSRQADAEKSVRQIAANISAIRDPDAVLQQTVDEARRLLDAESARIDLLDGDTLTWAFASGASSVETREAGIDTTSKVGQGVTGTAVAHGATFHTNDYLADDAFAHLPASDALVRKLGVRSVLASPLLGEAGALGALTVSTHRSGAFGDPEEALLQALADHAAITIQNARLIAQLNQSRGELAVRAETERSLRDIAAQITSLRDPAEILARVVEESRRLLRSDGAHLTRLAEDGTYLVPVIVAGGMDDTTEGWLKRMQFPLGGGINGLAAEEVRPIWTRDYREDPRIPHEPDDVVAAERLGLRAMAAAPLRAPAGEVIGTLAVSYGEPRDILPDELDLLQGLADQAAIALTNSNLYELLGESEARYRHLVQNSPDLVWSIDADAKFTFVSDTCERLTGWQPDELLGRHFGALVHESSRDVAELDWTADMTEEFQELRGRLNLLHRDGHPIPAEFSAFGTIDDEGRFAGANGSVRDMSERDRLERELRESEERYRFLVENAPDIIFSIDPDGLMTYVSETVSRALGYRPEDVIGRPFRNIIEYDDPSQAGVRFAQMREDPSREVMSDLMLIHADGRRIPFEVSSRGVVRDGVFAGIHGSARDMSERHRLERELREAGERYRFLVENSPDVVFSTDTEGNFTYLSETIERMTGHPPAELVGGHFSRVVDENSLPVAMERWTALATDPSTEQIARLNLVHRDGRLVPVEVSAIGTTIDGRFVGIHGATRDVSVRERLEQDLRRQAGELASSQERAHLARELHDSVTQALFSMTLVTRTTELLVDRDTVAAKEKLGSLRDLQREALAEMRALIFELRPGNIEEDGLLAALKTHTAALQGRIGLPIVVTSELNGRLPLELEEVLYRISQEALHNVVKHAAAHQVTLSIDQVFGGVRLRIVDDGKGFNAAAVPDGHLGLAGMRARADKIGATLAVTSRTGTGTTIEVHVPEAAIAAARTVPRPARVPASAE